ncbi:MAG TPA: MauE/DoxX family redox-associated membrane protein [Acidimicrobiales bacterium]
MLPALVDVVVWLAAAVLVAAGALKLRRPVPAALFVRRLGLPATPPAVRAVAVVEIVVGVEVLALGGALVPAAAVTLYLAFLASLAWYYARTGERTVSCGCFGGTAPVPIVPHAAALLVALVATTASALIGREPLVDVLGSVPAPEALLLIALLGLTLVALLGWSTGRPAPASAADVPTFRIGGVPPGGEA